MPSGKRYPSAPDDCRAPAHHRLLQSLRMVIYSFGNNCQELFALTFSYEEFPLAKPTACSNCRCSAVAPIPSQ
jgi:hypothetical protein